MAKIQMIACHYANRSVRGVPACFLPIETVRDLVEAGQAVWNKRATCVNFTKTEAQMHRPAQSLTMGVRVMDGVAQGKSYALELLKGWTPRHLLKAA